MTDSSQPAESLPRAHCSACGATFRVRDAERTYRCRHCGGEVRAAPERGSAARDHLAAADARRREERVRDLARDRDERQERVRGRRNSDLAFKLIGSILVLELLVLAAILYVVGSTAYTEFGSGKIDLWSDPLRPTIATAIVVTLIVLTILMLRRLRRAPVRIAIAIAVLQSLPVFYEAESVLPLVAFIDARSGSTVIWAIVPLILRLLLAAFHWFASDWLRVRAAEREQLLGAMRGA